MTDTDKDIESAILDSSTGLYNSSYFLRRLKQVISCSRRHKFPVSAVIVNFNIESDGNLEQRFVLSVLGKSINNSIRWDSDIAARIGENKIGIILVHCKKEDAERVIKRILAALKTSQGEGGKMVTVSLKIGYSSLDLSHDALSLLKEAEDNANITEKIDCFT